MTLPNAPGNNGTSTRPYLIRALHEWCTENGFTPYVAVYVDASVRVPPEYVKNSEIVLNVGFEATSGLKLGNEFIEFKARFGGSAREIVVPVTHVIAIYARENGQGMAFPAPQPGGHDSVVTPAHGLASVLAPGQTAKPGGVQQLNSVALESPSPSTPPEPPRSSAGSRPALKRIK